MRTIVDRLRDVLAFRSGAAARALSARAGRWLVLAYHNIRPDGAPPRGERALHLSRADFGRQLDFLRAHCDVVSLEALTAFAPAGRPRVALTLDDGYAGALTGGVEELTRRGLPATLFVVPGRLGHAFWWDRLADGRGGTAPPDWRPRLLDTLGGEEGPVGDWAEAQGIPLAADLPDWARAGSEEDVARAYDAPGISLAAHTWTHPNLAALPPARLTEELERPRTWLAERFPRALPWLAFPYGRHSDAVTRAAARAGYAGCVAIGQRTMWMDRLEPGGTPVVLPRLDVPAGWPLGRFALRVAGR